MRVKTHKRRKHSRMRGSHTHGWGAKKKHRGAGHRGGRGMAGSGKRADQKKSMLNVAEYFGKHGFVKKNVQYIKAITVRDVEERLTAWLRENTITMQNGIYEINLDALGYTKLLAKGAAHQKMKITIRRATPRAVEYVKAAGGMVVLQQNQEKEEQTQ